MEFLDVRLSGHQIERTNFVLWEFDQSFGEPTKWGWPHEIFRHLNSGWYFVPNFRGDTLVMETLPQPNTMFKIRQMTLKYSRDAEKTHPIVEVRNK